MEINDREKLVAAFEHMVENVSESVHKAEEALAPTIDEMVHNAQQLAREVYTLTQEEAEGLGATLKRDMQKANQAINQQKKELKDWLSFDLAVVEDRFIDMIARAADKAWLDFRAFENEDHQASLYRSGEVCNAGSLSCSKCGEVIRLSAAAQIPPCPACHHDKFYRVIG
ncbi:MAG: zinc ribbon-containing protein [Gammaproteobacteria bacterium]|nr:zinc ribbon-containing protein [Gammaproteobacteria bacterium]